MIGWIISNGLLYVRWFAGWKTASLSWIKDNLLNILDYIEKLKTHLLIDPIVDQFQIIRQRITETDGHIRAKISLSKNYFMEFSEYVQLSRGDAIRIETYSYHCFDASGNLIIR